MGRNHGKIRIGRGRQSPGPPLSFFREAGRGGREARPRSPGRLGRRLEDAAEKVKRFVASPLGQFCVVLTVAYLLLAGCGGSGGVSGKIDRIKILPEEVKESLRHGIVDSTAASASALAGPGFSISRIEMQKDYAAVEARRGTVGISCRLNALTEDLTRIRVRVHNSELVADSEARPEKLFEKIRDSLASGPPPDLEKIVGRMTPVFVAPDPESPAVAWLAPGAEAILIDDEKDPDWSKVKLTTGNFGYIPARNVKPMPF